MTAGEWKLGNEAEPLKSQLKYAKKTLIHPKYQEGYPAYNLGLIIVEISFDFDNINDHISPICLEFGNLVTEEHCVVLGWGEEVLNCKFYILLIFLYF